MVQGPFLQCESKFYQHENGLCYLELADYSILEKSLVAMKLLRGLYWIFFRLWQYRLEIVGYRSLIVHSQNLNDLDVDRILEG